MHLIKPSKEAAWRKWIRNEAPIQRSRNGSEPVVGRVVLAQLASECMSLNCSEKRVSKCRKYQDWVRRVRSERQHPTELWWMTTEVIELMRWQREQRRGKVPENRFATNPWHWISSVSTLCNSQCNLPFRNSWLVGSAGPQFSDVQKLSMGSKFLQEARL